MFNKGNQSITCDTLEVFLKCIIELTKQGLTFEAYEFDLVIKLTGGY